LKRKKVWLRDRNAALLLSDYRSVTSVLEFDVQNRHKYTQNCCSRNRRFNSASKKIHHWPFFEPVPTTSQYCSCVMQHSINLLPLPFTNRHVFSSVFSGALTRLRKASTNFVMSVRLSTWNNSAPTGPIFVKFDIWVFFKKIYLENSSLIKIWQEYGVLYIKAIIHFLSYQAHFFLEREIFQTQGVNEFKTRALSLVNISENGAVYGIERKNILQRIGHRWKYGACA